MEHAVRKPGVSDPVLEDAPTIELVARFAKQSTALVKKELELAQAELREDWKRELRVVKGVALALVCALVGINLLMVAAVFGLAEHVAGWVAALVVAGLFLGIGAVVGRSAWARRVRNPLAKTRKTVKEDLEWAKERLA